MFIINYILGGSARFETIKRETIEKEDDAVARYEELRTNINVYQLTLAKTFYPTKSSELVEKEFRQGLQALLDRFSPSMESVARLRLGKDLDGTQIVVSIPAKYNPQGDKLSEATVFILGEVVGMS